ncbi:lanthionine synthetase C family protein [Paenibacillus macerans]|uniref:lanthionine synthetase C family protein n=1 Tax=Paenibacillus macerans TaxID=44252 RepID=UPI00203F344A|nr:lanthionine synthetase C family protein [Paenibacillus macerans]MCM3699010.1 lanthionine synthetase C family protein [Paenibacillus macerans]
MGENMFTFQNLDRNMARILNKYLCGITSQVDSVNRSFYDAVTINMVLAESYDFIVQKAEIDELLYRNMKIIREGLEHNILNGNLSLFGGLAEVALSVFTVHKRTNYYGKFLNKINILLTDQLSDYMNLKYKKKDTFLESDYDAISGLSGIASYLLLLEGYEEITQEILEFIVLICSYKQLDGVSIPNFCIQNENTGIEFGLVHHDGHINLGLAHGIAGPLVVLSNAYKKGYMVKGQRKIISNILDIYRKFAIVRNKRTYWSGMIPLNEYLSGASELGKTREGWCYGGIAIARALHIAANALNDSTAQRWAEGIITERVKMDLADYELISPTLCHGYAGVLSILVRMARQTEGTVELIKKIETVREKIMGMFDESAIYGFIDIEIREINGEYVKTSEDTCIFLIGSSGVILALLSVYRDSPLLNCHLLI